MNDPDKSINRLIKNSAEVITEDEFRQRLKSGGKLTHYIGFEISGYVHLGTGLMSALVIKDLQALGVNCTIWLADWHTFINEKLDGTFETAQAIGRGYFKEAMVASLLAVGADPTKVEFKLASDSYYQNSSTAYHFWETVIRVSQHTSTSRMLRSIDILGRKLGTDVDHAKTIYPAMQAADVFFLEVDIAHAGMDQRKAHVIMRDTANKVNEGKPKPIALHHPLLIGLQKPNTWPIPEGVEQKDVIAEMKMSKSNPHSAIWVHDAPEEITKKINKAFCPEKEINFNPILNWIGHLLWWDRQEPFRVERKPEHGGGVEFGSYEELEQAYADGDIHPMDLKAAVTKELIALLAPAREHFAKPEIAAKKAELDKIITRQNKNR